MVRLRMLLVMMAMAGVSYSQVYKTSAFENSPIGFASVHAYGQNGTTGGAGGDTLYFTSRAPIQAFMNARAKAKITTPKVLVIQGTVTNDTSISQIYVKRVANLTIIGKGNDALLDGQGLAIIGSRNIIVRNLTMRNAKPDCVTIATTGSDTCHHIWIDHCTFSDDPMVDLSSSGTHDGLLDISHRSNYVTVSWCEFHNHDKVSLLGYSDNSSDEVGYLSTTYHHNWWNNTVQRHPRVRYASCHVYNNFYDGTTTPAGTLGMGTSGGYGITSTCEADVLVEANYFDKVINPAEVGQGSSPVGDMRERYNLLNNCTNGIQTRATHATPFEPSGFYSYSLDSAATIPALVKAGAGAGKLSGPSSIKELGSNGQIPDSYSLRQNYPNPFNPSTMISYALPVGGHVTLKVYDQLGKEISTLVNEEQAVGAYRVVFSASNLTSGLYFYTLKAGTYSVTRKMIFMK